MRAPVTCSPSRRATMVLTGRGTEQHAKGVDTFHAWINLALALGLPGKPSSGWGTLTGQGNGQGGREHGQKADQLPGYRLIETPPPARRRRRVGHRPRELPRTGCAYELLDRLGTPGGVRALLVLARTWPCRRHAAAHCGNDSPASTSSACATFPSETAELADVVLPMRPVGRRGGHDDQPRGPVSCGEPAVDRRPRACAATST